MFVQSRDQITQILGRVGTAANVAELDGFEGAGARNYFAALMTINTSGFKWEGRKKHPATDPINALLSLTYSLLTHELTALLEGFALDPYLGFLSSDAVMHLRALTHRFRG
jgi:CRISPR-associated protein Cas1